MSSGMNLPDSARQKLEAVLRDEKLDDRSRYDAPGFFDEIPLYSRYRQVAFLQKYGDPEKLLIEFALEYLESIAQAKRSPAECFASITVMEHQDAELIVPCIYLCNGRIKSRLRTLRLARPLSKFAAALKSSLEHLGSRSRYALAQDTISAPGHVRVFIGFRKPVVENMITLRTLTEMLPKPLLHR